MRHPKRRYGWACDVHDALAAAACGLLGLFGRGVVLADRIARRRR